VCLSFTFWTGAAVLARHNEPEHPIFEGEVCFRLDTVARNKVKNILITPTLSILTIVFCGCVLIILGLRPTSMLIYTPVLFLLSKVLLRGAGDIDLCAPEHSRLGKKAQCDDGEQLGQCLETVAILKENSADKTSDSVAFDDTTRTTTTKVLIKNDRSEGSIFISATDSIQPLNHSVTTPRGAVVVEEQTLLQQHSIPINDFVVLPDDSAQTPIDSELIINLSKCVKMVTATTQASSSYEIKPTSFDDTNDKDPVELQKSADNKKGNSHAIDFLLAKEDFGRKSSAEKTTAGLAYEQEDLPPSSACKQPPPPTPIERAVSRSRQIRLANSLKPDASALSILDTKLMFATPAGPPTVESRVRALQHHISNFDDRRQDRSNDVDEVRT